jgi:hypothetical protein
MVASEIFKDTHFVSKEEEERIFFKVHKLQQQGLLSPSYKSE